MPRSACAPEHCCVLGDTEALRERWHFVRRNVCFVKRIGPTNMYPVLSLFLRLLTIVVLVGGSSLAYAQTSAEERARMEAAYAQIQPTVLDRCASNANVLYSAWFDVVSSEYGSGGGLVANYVVVSFDENAARQLAAALMLQGSSHVEDFNPVGSSTEVAKVFYAGSVEVNTCRPASGYDFAATATTATMNEPHFKRLVRTCTRSRSGAECVESLQERLLASLVGILAERSDHEPTHRRYVSWPWAERTFERHYARAEDAANCGETPIETFRIVSANACTGYISILRASAEGVSISPPRVSVSTRTLP